MATKEERERIWRETYEHTLRSGEPGKPKTVDEATAEAKKALAAFDEMFPETKPAE